MLPLKDEQGSYNFKVIRESEMRASAVLTLAFFLCLSHVTSVKTLLCVRIYLAERHSDA